MSRLHILRLAGGIRYRGGPQLALPERALSIDLIEYGLLCVGVLAGVTGFDGSMVRSLRAMRIGGRALKRGGARTTRQRDKQAAKEDRLHFSPIAKNNEIGRNITKDDRK